MEEKVSVIIALYNCENKITRCIESIENQTYKNIEIIVCDDCSTDNSFEVVKELTKKYDNIILLKNEKNLKAAATRNRCIEKASGEYIAVQDADDYSHLDRLQKEVEELRKNKEIGFVSTDMYRINNKGIYGIIRTKEEYPTNKSFFYGAPYAHGSAMFRKTALEKVNGYDTSEKYMRIEDANLFEQLHLLGIRGKNIQEPLYYYQEDENAYSRRKYRYRILAFKMKFNFFRKTKLMPAGFFYALRPLIVGLVPNKIAYYIKRKVRK